VSTVTVPEKRRGRPKPRVEVAKVVIPPVPPERLELPTEAAEERVEERAEAKEVKGFREFAEAIDRVIELGLIHPVSAENLKRRVEEGDLEAARLAAEIILRAAEARLDYLKKILGEFVDPTVFREVEVALEGLRSAASPLDLERFPDVAVGFAGRVRDLVERVKDAVLPKVMELAEKVLRVASLWGEPLTGHGRALLGSVKQLVGNIKRESDVLRAVELLRRAVEKLYDLFHAEVPEIKKWLLRYGFRGAAEDLDRDLSELRNALRAAARGEKTLHSFIEELEDAFKEWSSAHRTIPATA